MNLEMWISNLWFFSLQTGILILVGGVLAWIFRFRQPSGLYLYWRLLLVGCLILVFQPGVAEPGSEPVTIPSFGVSILEVSPTAYQGAARDVDWYPSLGGLLVAGFLLRLIWLGIGFYRLHCLKLRTRHLVLSPHLRLLKERLEVSAKFRISAEVSGPITFGWLQPIVVFPESLRSKCPS